MVTLPDLAGSNIGASQHAQGDPRPVERIMDLERHKTMQQIQLNVVKCIHLNLRDQMMCRSKHSILPYSHVSIPTDVLPTTQACRLLQHYT